MLRVKWVHTSLSQNRLLFRHKIFWSLVAHPISIIWQSFAVSRSHRYWCLLKGQIRKALGILVICSGLWHFSILIGQLGMQTSQTSEWEVFSAKFYFKLSRGCPLHWRLYLCSVVWRKVDEEHKRSAETMTAIFMFGWVLNYNSGWTLEKCNG